MCKRVYKPGTPFEEMVWDGWSRGFKPEQTIEEMKASGFVISKDFLKLCWHAMDLKCESERPDVLPEQPCEVCGGEKTISVPTPIGRGSSFQLCRACQGTGKKGGS